METKRVLIATVLCLIIIVGWNQLAIYMGWMPPPPTAEEIAEQQKLAQLAQQNADIITNQSSTPQVPASAVFAPQDGREIYIETPLYTALINSSGAVLNSFKLKNYSAELGTNVPVELISEQASLVSPMGILYNGRPTWYDASWYSDASDTVLNEGQSTTLIFHGSLENGKINIKRTLTFSADTYLIKENFEILPSENTSARISFTLATTSLVEPEDSYNVMKVTFDKNGLEEETDVKDLTNEGFLSSGSINWAGLASNYFLTAVAPVSSSPSILKARIQADVWRVALEESELLLKANQAHSMDTYWWFGAKERHLLENAPQNLELAVDLGFFNILGRPMLWVMKILYDVVHNWGVAIILFTILIKIAFWPLTKSSFTSMEKMKRIQPMMKELQEKHKDNKEEMSREMMQLYKTYGVNPLGGCLPILVQIPVFIALYQVLMQSLDLRHSSFITYLPFTDIIWLADLSAKDPLYITPLVMGASMFLQQYLTPSMGDPMQRKMMLLMPVIFTFMFLNFPSGLVLYWLMNNVFSIVQQWYTLRKIK